MKGKLIKRDNNWYVTHIMDDNGVKFGVDYPLSIDDVNQIEADAKIFDNIEARISAYPDCIFEIITIDNGDNGVRYAKLIPDVNNRSQALDFLVEQAQKLDLGYNTLPKNKIVKMTEEEWIAAEKQKEYETK